MTEHTIVPDVFTGIVWGSHEDISDSVSAFTVPDAFNKKQCQLAIGFGIQVLDASNNFSQSGQHIMVADDYMPGISRVLYDKAREYGYDNIISACSYTGSTITQFQEQSIAFNAWRDAVWNTSFVALADYQTNGTMPKIEDFLATLPTYESFLPPTP